MLSPILLLSLALAVEIGSLQLQRQRLVSALDQSVVVASATAALAGVAAQLDPQVATDAVRTSLAENLTPLTAILAGVSPLEVARGADVIVVTNVPSSDPLGGGRVLTHPTIVARIFAPVKTGLLAAAGLPSTTILTLTARADLSFTGAGT